MRTRIIVLAAFALFATACEVEPADGAGGTIQSSDSSAESDTSAENEAAAPSAETDDPEPEPEAAAESSEVGTRGNPAAIGDTAAIGDWDVRILDVNLDASALVAEENMFNDPPAEGQSFVMWGVEATYTGTESGTAWIDLSWKIVGAEGNSFDSSCGVLPDDLDDAGETFPGATVTGNVCISAETSQLSGGTILVEELFGGSRTFFAIP